MIHLLEKNIISFDPNSDFYLVHYVDLKYIADNVILQSDAAKNILKNQPLVHTLVSNETEYTYEDLENYIIKNPDMSVFIFNLEIVKDYQRYSMDVVYKLSKKYSKLKFIVSSYETYPMLDFQSNYSKNVFYLINGMNQPYRFHKNLDNIFNVVNFYKINLYLQDRYNPFISKLFNVTSHLRRFKKYNFFNGIHKPHRLKCYEIVKNNNLIDEGFFSYIDYEGFITDKNHYSEFIDFFGFKNEDEYLEYLKNFQIPYLCDSDVVTPNIFASFTLSPQYALQSYILITTETNFLEGYERDDIITSEKAFKAFNSFNIPLIFGQPRLVAYLKDMGFDMFDDLFDTEEKFSREDMFKQFEKNIKIIKNTSLEDLRKYYNQNTHRIQHNFFVLTNIQKQKDIDKFNSFIANTI
jgi:hypothetical protein